MESISSTRLAKQGQSRMETRRKVDSPFVDLQVALIKKLLLREVGKKPRR
jgi:hypothetical protein